VTVEDVPSDLDLAFIDADVVAVAAQKPVAAFVADPKPDVVADDGGGGGDSEDDPDRQFVGAAGVGARGDQDRLARGRTPRCSRRW